MQISEYGTIKVLNWSNNITKDELLACSEVLMQWAEDNQEYAIVSFIPANGKTVTDLSSIADILKPLRRTKLRVYGVQNSAITSFVAKIVSQLLGLKLTETKDYPALLAQMSADSENFKRDIEAYNLLAEIEAIA